MRKRYYVKILILGLCVVVAIFFYSFFFESKSVDFVIKKSPHNAQRTFLTVESFNNNNSIQFNSIRFDSIIMGVGPSSESHKAQYNVAVLGAAGGIGQTLSLLMKQSKFIKSLRLCEFSRVSQIFILLMVLSFPTHQKIPLDDDPIFTVTVFVVVFLFLFFFLCYECVI